MLGAIAVPVEVVPYTLVRTICKEGHTMAIIRNDRRAREEQAEAQRASGEDDQLVADYSWHPSLEEFDPQLTAEDWLQLLSDPTVFDEDGLRAVECLHEFGVPTTLQQLSVRYRGTMGRYRRWLNTTAERVGHHLGIEAPEHDQYGNDEWWPLLYQRRGIGKAAANQHELRLRDELAEALDLRTAEKKKARHREEQAQAKERERQVRAQAEALRSSTPSSTSSRRGNGESVAPSSATPAPSPAEQRRAAQEARAEREAKLSQITVDRTTESVPDIDAPQQEEPAPKMTKAQAAVAARIARAQQRAGAGNASTASREEPEPQVVPVGQGVHDIHPKPDAKARAAVEAAAAHEDSHKPSGHKAGSRQATEVLFPIGAIRTYLAALDKEHATEAESGATSANKPNVSHAQSKDVVHLPVDYAVRYSNRLWTAFDLISEAAPGLTAARVARLMGCKSVEPVQQMLNGEEIPSFALVDTLCRALGLSHEYLESADENEASLPVFSTVQELTHELSVGEVLGKAEPSHIYVLKNNDDNQAATVVLRFGSLRCLLLDRYGAPLDAGADDDAVYTAFVALVHDLQEYALKAGVALSNVSLSGKNWRLLQKGRVWPGTLLS